MKVEKIMHKGATWIKPSTPLAVIARKMRRMDIGAIPVGENDRLIGMVTDRDICCRGLTKNGNPAKLTARDVMTKRVIYCQASQPVGRAVDIMRKAKVRRLPVIDAKKRMVGLLSLGDLAAKADRKTVAAAVKAVSAHHSR
jgi:CBS domain-containing protein